jgi:hypothetical protein
LRWLLRARRPWETAWNPSQPEEADVLRILFRIVTVVSAVKLIAGLIGRRRYGGR